MRLEASIEVTDADVARGGHRIKIGGGHLQVEDAACCGQVQTLGDQVDVAAAHGTRNRASSGGEVDHARRGNLVKRGDDAGSSAGNRQLGTARRRCKRLGGSCRTQSCRKFRNALRQSFGNVVERVIGLCGVTDHRCTSTCTRAIADRQAVVAACHHLDTGQVDGSGSSIAGLPGADLLAFHQRGGAGNRLEIHARHRATNRDIADREDRNVIALDVGAQVNIIKVDRSHCIDRQPAVSQCGVGDAQITVTLGDGHITSLLQRHCQDIHVGLEHEIVLARLRDIQTVGGQQGVLVDIHIALDVEGEIAAIACVDILKHAERNIVTGHGSGDIERYGVALATPQGADIAIGDTRSTDDHATHVAHQNCPVSGLKLVNLQAATVIELEIAHPGNTHIHRADPGAEGSIATRTSGQRISDQYTLLQQDTAISSGQGHGAATALRTHIDHAAGVLGLGGEPDVAAKLPGLNQQRTVSSAHCKVKV